MLTDRLLIDLLEVMHQCQSSMTLVCGRTCCAVPEWMNRHMRAHAQKQAPRPSSLQSARAVSCGMGLAGEAAAHCRPHSQEVSRADVDAGRACYNVVCLHNTAAVSPCYE